MSFSPLIWLTIGLVLTALEIVTGGFILFWFGVGGLLTSALMFFGLLPNGIAQWLFFISSSLVMLLIWTFWFKKYFISKQQDDSHDPTLTNLTGKVIKAIEPNKEGRVELFENYHGIKEWPAFSDVQISEGSEIVVLKARGIRLVVIPKK